MSHVVVSPLEALRQPPMVRTPQAIPQRQVTSGGTDGVSETSDDDDTVGISFPTVVSMPSSSSHQSAAEKSVPDSASAAAQSSVSSVKTAYLASSKNSGGSKKRKKLPTKKVLHVCFTKYPVIREVADEMGFTMDTVDEELEKYDFNMIWSDTVLPLQKLVRLLNWQRTNHFPSMHLLCRKVHLGLTLGRMRKVFPQHYNFFPRTWSMRSERQQFARFFSQQPTRKVFILKPNAGCQGRGIILSKDPLNAVEDLDNFVCQEYVTRPLLIEGKKFDLRVYCLVSSIRHLSIFVYNDGLVRMCAEDYEKPNDDNMHNACKHLTNYAVNKHNENFVFNNDKQGRGDLGNKRDFVWLNGWFKEQGHSPEKFWERVHHMIIKTIIAAQPQMTHVYNSCFPHSNDGYTCFEVLGFDILVDDRCKPVLMEVNHTPSLSCDTPLDHRIKHDLITETWKIIDVQPTDKQRHLDREKAQFARRIQQPASKGSSSMMPIDSMLSTAQVTSPDQLLGGFGDEALLTAEGLAAEHRRKEDMKLKNYKRVYPSTSIEKQALYETILAAAKTASAIPTTASQEQRQLEVRAEREKRESNKRGSTTAPPSLPGGSLESSRRSQQRSGLSSAGSASIQPQPPSITNSGNVTPTSDTETPTAQPFVRSNLAAPTAPQRTAATSRVAGRQGSVSSSAEKPKRTKEEIERQRQKLAEQMERHRRRMVLGPRLSVFQLREAQLAAMFHDDMDGTSESTGEERLLQRALSNGQTSSSGGSVQTSSLSLPSSYGQPNNNGLSVLGTSNQASHHEQFQAILLQLSRYQQLTNPDYRYGGGGGVHSDQRFTEAALQQAILQRQQLQLSGAVRHHQGLDLGDIEEDDDFGAGGGMYYEEEEEE